MGSIKFFFVFFLAVTAGYLIDNHALNVSHINIELFGFDYPFHHPSPFSLFYCKLANPFRYNAAWNEGNRNIKEERQFPFITFSTNEIIM